MKVAGVIAEYNPFHRGHALQLKATRAAGVSHIAVVMSGNFVQRGEPSVCPKAARVRAALQNGADLVLELPLPWAVASAEGFAHGAVSLLWALGCVDILSFGSETGDASRIAAMAAACDAAEGSPELKAALGTGLPFAQARAKAARALRGIAIDEAGPNDTLAIEYLRAISSLGGNMAPLAVKRMGAAHDAPGLCGDTGAGFPSESAPGGAVASASEVRRLLTAGEVERACAFLPPTAAALLREAVARFEAPFDYGRFAMTELSFLRRLSPSDFALLDDVGEGLENRLYGAVRQACSVEELLTLTKTRRYAHARLRRVLLGAFLGLGGGFRKSTPPYLRVLGANGRGRELLRRATSAGRLPVVSRTAQFAALGEEARRVFALECRGADLYTLGLPHPGPCGSEQRFSPIFPDVDKGGTVTEA